MKYLFLMLFVTATAVAADSIVSYSIAGKVYEFEKLKTGELIGNYCAAKKNCMVGKPRPAEKIGDFFRPGGANPGSAYCKNALKGKVVMGFNPKIGQQSFCLFSDGSMIDNYTLLQSLKKN